MDMVATAFETIALDCVSDLDVWVNPFIGYAPEGFVVTPYLQLLLSDKTF